jgi:hypothetical protein
MKNQSNLTGRILVLFISLLISLPAISQKETHLYIGTNGKLTRLKDALYLQSIKRKSRNDAKVQTYQLVDSDWKKIYAEHYKKKNDSTWQIKGNGKDIAPINMRIFTKQADTLWKFRDEVEGQVIKKGTAKSVMPLLLQGQVTEFYPGGAKKSVSLYKNNQLISNENWREDGQKYIDNIFYSADVFPTYSLGNKFLNNHIMQCYKNSGLDISTISGSLKVGFVVMEDGSIDGIKILKGLGPKLNETACHAFATLKGQWTPAKLNNKTVRYFQVFPINFIFNEDRLEYAEIRDAVLHYQNY